jgi:hypothetical protein
LREGDILRFGASTREYIVRLCYNKNSITDYKADANSMIKVEEQKEEKGRTVENNESVSCYHLLVKHENSRRPSSWRNKEITITKEEALENIETFKKEIENLEDKKEKI